VSSYDRVQPVTAFALAATITQMIPPDITPNIARGWINNPDALGKGLRKLLMPPAETVPDAQNVWITIVRLEVNYGLSIEDAETAGHYDCVNERITSEYIPTAQSGKEDVLLHLLHFDRVVYFDEVTEEMKRHYLRPAGLHELLAFGASWPEHQRQFPIIAPGYRVLVGEYTFEIPYLHQTVNLERTLDLCGSSRKYHPDSRFIAVPI